MFAKIFSSSINICGRRSEIVRVEGFKLGNLARFAFDQSIKSLESRLAQKARSSFSDLNLGILVFMGLIGSLLLAAHVPGRNNPNRCSTNGENHEKESGAIRLTQRVIAEFALGVFVIIRDEQRRVKENLLALGLGNAMLAVILLFIALIPLKLRAAKEDFFGIAHG